MIFLSLAPKKEVSGIKRFQGGVCVSCVRLRFVFTKLIVPTLLRLLRCFAENKVMPSEKVSDGICVSCVRLRFVFTKLIVPTLVARARCAFCGGIGCMKSRCRYKTEMPSEKGFRRHLCAMCTITLCFHKANRTYACCPCASRFLRCSRRKPA